MVTFRARRPVLDVLRFGGLAHNAKLGRFATRAEPILRMPIAPVCSGPHVRTDFAPDRRKIGRYLAEACHFVVDWRSVETIEVEDVRPPGVEPAIADARIVGQMSEPPLMIRGGGDLKEE